MNKKFYKQKKGQLKLTPPQRSHLKSNQKEEVAFEKNISTAESAPKDSPLNNQTEPSVFKESEAEKEPMDSPPFTSKTEDEGEVSEAPSVSEASPKKESLLKGFHKKKISLRKPAKKNPLEEELKALESRYLYLKADFENYKKRALQERRELLRYGGEEFIRSLIDNVLDDFDRAYGDLRNTKSLENFKSGIDLIYKNLKKILNTFHVEALDPQGQPFDPNCHEALSRQPTNKVPKDHVLITFKKAYTLYEKLIRPAQVIVAVPSGDFSNTDEDDSSKE